MDGKFQHQITFFLTGNYEGSNLRLMDASYRPAIFARYHNLRTLRYDFPLILNHNETQERSLFSLSGLIDAAVEIYREDPDRDQIARIGYRIENEIRRQVSESGASDFEKVWQSAVTRLAGGDQKIITSANQLWRAFRATGEIVDADSSLPSLVVKHCWKIVQQNKAKKFYERSAGLLLKLHDILSAEIVGSELGKTPEKLRAGVGSSFSDVFDFEAMSRILVEAKPGIELPERRRIRIQKAIDILENQRFFPTNTFQEAYDFSFSRCSDALTAYRERQLEAIQLVKTLAIAELEANGEYREANHDYFFEHFGANGLDADDLAKLPDYLVCTDAKTLDSEETALMIETLSAGLPIKVLVQTDDILEPSNITEGRAALGLRTRQLVNTAIGLTDVFVLQASASHLFKKHNSMLRGLSYDGPALFSVFSGANQYTGSFPAYLVAAAATESRVFPTLVYDPSAGSDWASRLIVSDNPSADDDWTTHKFSYEDKDLQSQSDNLAFTSADFMAMDNRYFRHFGIVSKADWNDSMVSVPFVLDSDSEGLPNTVPTIKLIDPANQLIQAIPDVRMLLEVRRCRTMWHSLQELGGIHNSHAERLLALERKKQSDNSEITEVVSQPTAAFTDEIVSQIAETPKAEPKESKTNLDDPYIESARCTSCNECIQLNGKMFAYDENKQAFIADPNAGTYRQLVEAAEGCQVSIIHPGKPRNLKEPGLDDLIKRASNFN